MNTPKKKTIPAKEMVADIRNGIPGADLMRKYDLSKSALDRVFEKLITAGFLTQADVDRRKEGINDDLDLELDLPPATAGLSEPLSEVNPSAPTAKKAAGQTTFKCPACNMPQPREFHTCPQCGVLVEKYLAKKADEEKLAAQRQKASRKRKLTTLIGVVAFLVVGLAAGYLYKQRGAEYQSESLAPVASKEGASAKAVSSTTGTGLTYKNLSKGLIEDLRVEEYNDPQDEEHKFAVGRNEASGISLTFKGTPEKVDKIELTFEPDNGSEEKLDSNLNHVAALLKKTVPKQHIEDCSAWLERALSRIDPTRSDNQVDWKDYGNVRVTIVYGGSQKLYLLSVDLPTQSGDPSKCRGMVRRVLENGSPKEIVDITFDQAVTGGCLGEASEFLRRRLVNINALKTPEPTIHHLCRNAHSVPRFLASLEFMLKNGANPNIRNGEGKTPLVELTWRHRQTPSDLTAQGIALLEKYGGR